MRSKRVEMQTKGKNEKRRQFLHESKRNKIYLQARTEHADWCGNMHKNNFG